MAGTRDWSEVDFMDTLLTRPGKSPLRAFMRFDKAIDAQSCVNFISSMYDEVRGVGLNCPWGYGVYVGNRLDYSLRLKHQNEGKTHVLPSLFMSSVI